MKTLALAFLATLAFAAPASAQTGPDYVFNVPVRIENTPPLAGRGFAVDCAVFATGADGRYIAARSAGGPEAVQTIGPTGFNGTVRVEVRLLPGMRRADVRRWDCGLRFFSVTNAAGAVVSWGTPNSTEALRSYPALTGQQIRRSTVYMAADFARTP
jgi:hypothetical protein